MILKWINSISTGTLLKVAAFGGIATSIMGLMTRHKISNNVKETEFYKDALANLRGHKGAVSLLGEPIKDLTINVGDLTNNFTKDNLAQYQVPIYGQKKSGTLYFWAEKHQPQDKWIVSKIELEFKDDPYKRLLIKGSNDT